GEITGGWGIVRQLDPQESVHDLRSSAPVVRLAGLDVTAAGAAVAPFEKDEPTPAVDQVDQTGVAATARTIAQVEEQHVAGTRLAGLDLGILRVQELIQRGGRTVGAE